MLLPAYYCSMHRGWQRPAVHVPVPGGIPALLTATRALTGLEKVSGSTNSPEVRLRVAVP